MKYYKQWTMTETLMSNLINLRKDYGTSYLVRCDYNQILFWTNTGEPELKVILYVEPSFSASQAAFDELIPNGKVRRFRVVGSSPNISQKFKGIL